MLLGFCFFEVVFLVSADGLARVWFSCEHGEQRVLVAAPRFALYVARNKHPPLAFWFEWMVLGCHLFSFCFCGALATSFSASHIVRQTDQKIYLLLLTFG
jgi:hypothetical protein